MIDTVTEMIDIYIPRKRVLKELDRQRRDLTVSTFLANLVVAAYNRIDPNRFVAISFDRSRYSATGLSYDAMRQVRDILWDRGLVEGASGYISHHWVDIMQRSSRTRLRATPALRELLEDQGINRRSVKSLKDQLVKLNRPDGDAGAEPGDVAASRGVVLRINARLTIADITLPDDAWEREAGRRSARQKPIAAPQNEQFNGDLAAVSLRRVFTERWSRGGRLYGGWWIGVSAQERAHIMIDGETTVELDYGQLHPSILLARVEASNKSDPYLIDGLPASTRPLGKDTFMRLLNRRTTAGEVPTLARVTPSYKHLLPAGMTYGKYVELYLNHMGEVSRWFGRDEGMKLQREDSDLAISIIDNLDKLGIAALPVHDSFIVKEQHGDTLKAIMQYHFRQRYKVTPIVRRANPAISPPPLKYHN